MFVVLVGALLATQPVSFAQALEQAAASPVVEAERRVGKRREAHAENVSRLSYNPALMLQPGARDMRVGSTGAEVYVGAYQRFNIAGLGKKREQALDREIEHDASMVTLTVLRVRRDVARAWLERWTAQQVMHVAQSEVGLASELEQRMAATLAAGEATRVELAVAREWRAEAGLTALSAEGEAFDAGVFLARALGLDDPEPLTVTDDLPEVDLPEEASLRKTLGQVGDAPAVAASRAEREAEAARLTEVTAARGPTMAVGALGWREGGGDIAAVATLEVDLPVFERGERERATGAAQVARADGQLLTSTIEARSERVRLLHEVQHTREVMELVDKQLVTSAEDLAEAQRRRLEAREGTAQDWVIARRSVLKAKVDAVRAHAAHVLARFLAAEAWQVGPRTTRGSR